MTSIGVVASRLKIAVDLEGWIGARATKINDFWFDCKRKQPTSPPTSILGLGVYIVYLLSHSAQFGSRKLWEIALYSTRFYGLCKV
jgi:hypothetical protein